ncbi:MAG: hypothetical protein Q8K82_25850, partial [Gemmatimonadaceae bacterium]|nr:hypothetical protein [Gemmatimonadaceae bacterium]
MCGIFGVMAGRNAPYDAAFLRRSLRTLARYSQSRGRDSSGLAFRDPAQGSLTVFKGALAIDALFKSDEVKRQLDATLSRWTSGAEQPFAVFGHSRLVTNGSQLTVENNQPAVTEGVVGIHNGIIVNDAAIWRAHPELTRHHGIDTEVFLALV